VFFELVDARELAGLLLVELIALLVMERVVIVLSGVAANHLALGGGV